MSSEPHTLRACFFQKDCVRTISIVNALGCQNIPQTYLKHLQGTLRTHFNQKTLKSVYSFSENLSRTSYTTLCVYVVKLKVLPSTIFLGKITKLTFPSSFVVSNILNLLNLALHSSFSEGFFTYLSLLATWFISVCKAECFLVKIC